MRAAAVAPGLRQVPRRCRDPKHKRHIELKDWIGYDFNPDTVDTERSLKKSSRWQKALVSARCDAASPAYIYMNRDPYRVVTVRCAPGCLSAPSEEHRDNR